MVLLAQSGDTRAQVLKSYNNLKAAIVKSKNTKELKAFVEVGRKALEQLIKAPDIPPSKAAAFTDWLREEQTEDLYTATKHRPFFDFTHTFLSYIHDTIIEPNLVKLPSETQTQTQPAATFQAYLKSNDDKEAEDPADEVGILGRAGLIVGTVCETLQTAGALDTQSMRKELHEKKWLGLLIKLLTAARGGPIFGPEATSGISYLMWQLTVDSKTKTTLKAIKADDTVGIAKIAHLFFLSNNANESIDLVRIMSAIGPEEKDVDGRKALIKRLIELESARWTEPLARQLFVAVLRISPKQRFASGSCCEVLNIAASSPTGDRPIGFPIKSAMINSADIVDNPKSKDRLQKQQIIFYVDKGGLLLKIFDEAGDEEDVAFSYANITALEVKVNDDSAMVVFEVKRPDEVDSTHVEVELSSDDRIAFVTKVEARLGVTLPFTKPVKISSEDTPTVPTKATELPGEEEGVTPAGPVVASPAKVKIKAVQPKPTTKPVTKQSPQPMAKPAADSVAKDSVVDTQAEEPTHADEEQEQVVIDPDSTTTRIDELELGDAEKANNDEALPPVPEGAITSKPAEPAAKVGSKSSRGKKAVITYAGSKSKGKQVKTRDGPAEVIDTEDHPTEQGPGSVKEKASEHEETPTEREPVEPITTEVPEAAKDQPSGLARPEDQQPLPPTIEPEVLAPVADTADIPQPSVDNNTVAHPAQPNDLPAVPAAEGTAGPPIPSPQPAPQLAPIPPPATTVPPATTAPPVIAAPAVPSELPAIPKTPAKPSRRTRQKDSLASATDQPSPLSTRIKPPPQPDFSAPQRKPTAKRDSAPSKPDARQNVLDAVPVVAKTSARPAQVVRQDQPTPSAKPVDRQADKENKPATSTRKVPLRKALSSPVQPTHLTAKQATPRATQPSRLSEIPARVEPMPLSDTAAKAVDIPKDSPIVVSATGPAKRPREEDLLEKEDNTRVRVSPKHRLAPRASRQKEDLESLLVTGITTLITSRLDAPLRQTDLARQGMTRAARVILESVTHGPREQLDETVKMQQALSTKQAEMKTTLKHLLKSLRKTSAKDKEGKTTADDSRAQVEHKSVLEKVSTELFA